MTDRTNWRGSPEFHPATLIIEEMDALGWARDHMALAMAATDASDPGVCRLKLDMYLDVGPTNDRLRLGDTGVQISRAFGLSDGFYNGLEATWLQARGIEAEQ